MRKRITTLGRGAMITLVVLGFIAPLAWMFLAAFKDNASITDPSQMIAFTPTLKNFHTVFITQDFAHYFFNSVLISGTSTFLGLVIGTPAAYATARFKLGGATGFIMFARVIPVVSLLIPWYFIFSQIGWVGTYQAMILATAFVSLPMVVAIMAGFYNELSPELEEAAMVDGLGRFGAFLRIVVPLSTPGLATSAILSFIFSWNAFLFALVLAGNQTMTMPAAMFQFMSYLGVDWGGLMAAAVVITLPVMLVALFLQRYIVAGLTAGTTKG
ncbi:MAG: carbohydrate ABC transporter permease [Propionibacteriaceae bacterium]|jgi:multiple sugar transport system permease protein|nr:carbohydrate ABC transporter permease [Propionibacteriaceae bacterium]